jgi:hypothetical protein
MNDISYRMIKNEYTIRQMEKILDGSVVRTNPGRIRTVVNDRLRRYTE